MRKTDVLIIGAGPAGIFTALELLKSGSRKHIVIVEKGKPVEKRSCPQAETKKMRELQALLQYHHRFFRRGRFF